MDSKTLSMKLWPPSQSTRLMLVERMTKNLSTPSVLSRKYGLLSKEEAEEDAKQIEVIAFASASQHFEKEPYGDGSSAVQLYAKESSKLMLDVIRRGPRTKEDGSFIESERDRVPHKTVASASQHLEKEPDGDGSSAVQLYAKASSKPMLDVIRRGPRTKEDGNFIESERVRVSQETVFDISGDRRAFIDAKEAEELLKPLREPSNKFTKICFSNRSFGLDSAHVAESILSSLRDQLTEIDLSDFIAGRSETEALEVMTIFSSALEGSKLRYLNLSNNALGEKGVRAFAGLLKSQHNLEELYLMNDGISEEAAHAVCELIPSTDRLRVLQFHNNMTGDEGAIAISELVKHSPLLEDFRCSSTRVGSEGGNALAAALGSCTCLKNLDLRDNMFGLESGIALSKVLPRFSDLTEIYLSYLNLEDEGSLALANALTESVPSLEVLEMAGNDITVEAAPALAACVAAKQFLTKLNLAENELKDEGAILIAKALEEGHGQLSEVDLSTNSIRRAGARCLAQAVVSKPEFKLLNINGNFISDEGVDEVKEVFKNSPIVLGPLEENDPEGEDYDEEAEEGGDDDEDELDSKLKGLEIKQEE